MHTVGSQLLCLCTATSNSRRANCPLPRHVTCTRNLRFSQRCDRHCVARYVVSGVSTASKRSETSLLTTLYRQPYCRLPMAVTLLYLPLKHQSPSHCCQNVLMINFSTEKQLNGHTFAGGGRDTGLSYVIFTVTGYRQQNRLTASTLPDSDYLGSL